MCGVAGIATTETPDPAIVQEMCGILSHRGPDGDGFHTGENVALGMRRLAIIDVAGGNQPVFNEDRSVVAVFNGEIYNFADLRRELMSRGHRFRSNSDSECIVHLYEEHGETRKGPTPLRSSALPGSVSTPSSRSPVAPVER
ncbi:hypothetical protein ABZW02_34665 [Streptomyces sp. NPDC005180]|uniref:hypothetical protein n=1 Tax=Streptomyces sp. NPDC005180 TaxID=3156868 RepID=UPI0033BD1592